MTRLNYLVAALVAVVASSVAACQQGPRDESGVRMHLSEPKTIAKTETPTNLPRYINLDNVVIEQISRDNGQMLITKYKKNGATLAQTENIVENLWFDIQTKNRLEDKQKFISDFGVMEESDVQSIKYPRIGYYVENDLTCALSVGFRARRYHYDNDPGRERPDTIVKINSCGLANESLQEIAIGVREMTSSDQAVISGQ